jgi:PKD repeat protein
VITEPLPLVVGIGSHSDVSCFNGSNGSAIANPSGGTPPYSFEWNSNPVQNQQAATGLVAGFYTVTVSDVNQCEGTVSVTINNPTQIITNVSGGGELCLGSSDTLTANASGGAGNYFYFWNNGLGFGASKVVSPAFDMVYVVTAFDQNGCQGVPDTTQVHVLSLFPQNVNVFANSPICPGTSSLVYATANVSPYDVLTFDWNMGLGPGPGVFLVNPLVPTTYSVTVTNSCGFEVEDFVYVEFKQLPDVNILPSVSSGCLPLVVQFYDSSTTIWDQIISWTWDFGDGTTSTAQNPEHTYSLADTFLVSLTVQTSGGCSQSSATSPYPVYVFNNPIAAFSVNSTVLYLPNDPVVCINQSSGATSYAWDFGDGTTSVLPSPVHNYLNLGTYTLSLISYNQHYCTDTASVEIIATGDIVFPNAFTPDQNGPSGGSYDKDDYSNHVFFPFATGVSDFHMLIFNRWGEIVFETNDINIGWDGYYRGKLAEQDVYVYKARAVFLDGRVAEKIGDVLLLQ